MATLHPTAVRKLVALELLSGLSRKQFSTKVGVSPQTLARVLEHPGSLLNPMQASRVKVFLELNDELIYVPRVRETSGHMARQLLPSVMGPIPLRRDRDALRKVIGSIKLLRDELEDLDANPKRLARSRGSLAIPDLAGQLQQLREALVTLDQDKETP